MEKEKPTLLKKIIFNKEKGNLPSNIAYEIYSSSTSGEGMYPIRRIRADQYNKADYLIISGTIAGQSRERPLAIVNENHSEEEVLSKMYTEAKKSALETANFKQSRLIDLTGNVEISEEDKKYL